MKIRSVTEDRRRHLFEVHTTTGRTLPFPFAMLDPKPTAADPVVRVGADPEVGRLGFTYVLKSGHANTVPLDQVLHYNRDPEYVATMALHDLTVEARRRLKTSGLSQREVMRRLCTSPPQFYRLIDPANTTKSIRAMIALLTVLGADVDVVVRDHETASAP